MKEKKKKPFAMQEGQSEGREDKADRRAKEEDLKKAIRLRVCQSNEID